MQSKDRSAFMALSELAEAGYILFEEGGRLGVWRRDVEHNVDYQMALLTNPAEYRLEPHGKAVSRDDLLNQTPIAVEELQEAEAAVHTLAGKLGAELAQLMAWGWEFPDDGRVSFVKRTAVGLEEVELLAYLDRKDHMAFELNGEVSGEAEALAWLHREDEARADKEMALLQDLFRALRE